MSSIYECPHCGFTTIWSFVWNSHLKRCKLFPEQFSCQNILRPYKCDKCKFETFYQVDHHNHIHSKTLCMYHTTEVPEKLKTHQEFICDRCIFSTFSKYFYEVHRSKITCWSTITNEGNMKCKECDKVVKSNGAFKMHVQHKHSGYINAITIYQCSRCTFTTQSRRNLREHVISWHLNPDEINWIKCAQCPYKTKIRKNLLFHISMQHTENPKQFSCEHCSFVSRYMANYRRHMLRKHREQFKSSWFQCKECPYKTQDKSSLNKHFKSNHKPTVLFKCDQCLYEGKHRNCFRDHVISKHLDPSKIEWLPCTACLSKFKTKRQLNRHMNTVHRPNDKMKSYKCEQCSYKTRYKRDLNEHIKLHVTPNQQALQCE